MGASGAQGCTGEKGAAAGSPWKLDREDRGRGWGGGKSKMSWLIHGLTLLPAAYSSIPCCFFPTSMSEPARGFDSYQVFGVL